MSGRAPRLLVAVSAIAVAAAGYFYASRDGGPLAPPTMRPDGERNDTGVFVRRRTVDYEAVLRSVLAENASFLAVTLSRDVVRDEYLRTSVRYVPLPDSTARVRVNYHVEYPIGFDLRPGGFDVSGGTGGLVVALHRPQLVARPSVKLLSYEVIESGLLIDEKSALLELQQSIEPAAEAKAAEIVARPDLVARSEGVFRAFLQAVLAKRGGGEPAPTITFIYR